jgi:hypothetical protein
MHVALISRDGGGTSLYHPKRIPYTVALGDAFKTPAEVPPTWLEFATSSLLDSKGRPWNGEVEKDSHERMMDVMMNWVKNHG